MPWEEIEKISVCPSPRSWVDVDGLEELSDTDDRVTIYTSELPPSPSPMHSPTPSEMHAVRSHVPCRAALWCASALGGGCLD